LFDFYKRVEVCDQGTLKDTELIERLEAHCQVLCIVNTRKHAKGLFDLLDEDGRYHLSTLMCPKHRRETMITIKRLLEGKPQLTCRVISTQVMEAGVDLDFPVGYRAMAGLDSIIQAAGRVNREGRQSFSEMFVFHPDTEYIKRTPLFIKQTASVAEKVMREHEADPISIEAIQAYYTTLYSLQDENNFDVKNIVGCLDRGDRRFEFDFATAAERFKLIDQDTVSVIIPYNDDAIRWIESLKHTDYPHTIIRKLQLYAVNIYEKEFLALQSLGVIQTLVEQYHVLDERFVEEYYHPKTGLVLPKDNGGEAVFFE
jgi:CRISPR-associated endonuclease/helicase Cas3